MDRIADRLDIQQSLGYSPGLCVYHPCHLFALPGDPSPQEVERATRHVVFIAPAGSRRIIPNNRQPFHSRRAGNRAPCHALLVLFGYQIFALGCYEVRTVNHKSGCPLLRYGTLHPRRLYVARKTAVAGRRGAFRRQSCSPPGPSERRCFATDRARAELARAGPHALPFDDPQVCVIADSRNLFLTSHIPRTNLRTNLR